MHELNQINDEVIASLRTKAYEKTQNPFIRLPALEKIGKHLKQHKYSQETGTYRWAEPLAQQIVQESPRILQEVNIVEGVETGRRTLRFQFFHNLEISLTDRMMEKLQTAFYLRYAFSYQLRNVENVTVILFSKTFPGSPWINALSESRPWLEAKRHEVDHIDCPNTKWSFVLEVVIDREPLMGTGPLPQWLRQKKGMIALDIFNDNLCLFRCIAVSRGARVDRSTIPARKLASSFYQQVILDTAKTSLEQLKKIEEHFKITYKITSLQVYEPTEDGEWHLTCRTGPCTESLQRTWIPHH